MVRTYINCSPSRVTTEMQTETTRRCHFPLVTSTHIEKSDEAGAGEDGEQRTPYALPRVWHKHFAWPHQVGKDAVAGGLLVVCTCTVIGLHLAQGSTGAILKPQSSYPGPCVLICTGPCRFPGQSSPAASLRGTWVWETC